MKELNSEVTKFLDELNHPFRNEIEKLREQILNANNQLVENIKWNGPNYSLDNEDRITMRIQPPKQIQVIFHCGAKVKQQPREKILKDDYGLLLWKENNRAVATFKDLKSIENSRQAFMSIVKEWLTKS